MPWQCLSVEFLECLTGINYPGTGVLQKWINGKITFPGKFTGLIVCESMNSSVIINNW